MASNVVVPSSVPESIAKAAEAFEDCMQLHPKKKRADTWKLVSRIPPADERNAWIKSPEFVYERLNLVGEGAWQVLRPGDLSAKSGRFLTAKNAGFHIVFSHNSKSENAGHRHERELFEGFMIMLANMPKEAPDSWSDYITGLGASPAAARCIEALVDELQLSEALLGLVDVTRPGTRPSPRKITGVFEAAPNIGRLVADIVLHFREAEPIHLSVKSHNGSTIANFGVGGLFEKGGGDAWVHTQHVSTGLLEALGVDLSLHGQLLGTYKTKRAPQEVVDASSEQKSATLSILRFALGWGYVYIRGGDNGTEVKVLDLREENRLDQVFGSQLADAEIRYPHFSSKQLTVKACAETGMKFVIELRDSHGKIAPTELKFHIE